MYCWIWQQQGRPGIASRISGCKEIIEHEKTGYLFERKTENNSVK